MKTTKTRTPVGKPYRKPSWLLRLYAQVIAPIIAAAIVLTPIGIAYWSVAPGGPYRAWFVKEFQVHAPKAAPVHTGSDSGSNVHLQKD
ncbi:hypothetical protein HMI48_09930 [Acidithiobacillus ferrooxidans]|uniref:hypothetical protein n=1 Tax=Acidithiobacillus ferrooxidans TaxID=920 RepID=UPI001C0774B4|nr:hypothetical protein [Acidithiobacillus ferrooxidans]MBU2774181.1 hypothetical protein [Acidithiobacillus ferrooxidans]